LPVPGLSPVAAPALAWMRLDTVGGIERVRFLGFRRVRTWKFGAGQRPRQCAGNETAWNETAWNKTAWNETAWNVSQKQGCQRNSGVRFKLCGQ